MGDSSVPFLGFRPHCAFIYYKAENTVCTFDCLADARVGYLEDEREVVALVGCLLISTES